MKDNIKTLNPYCLSQDDVDMIHQAFTEQNKCNSRSALHANLPRRIANNAQEVIGLLRKDPSHPEVVSQVGFLLKNNKDFYLGAVKTNANSFEYIPKKFQSDAEIVDVYRDRCLNGNSQERVMLGYRQEPFAAIKITAYKSPPRDAKEMFYSVGAYEKAFAKLLIRSCSYEETSHSDPSSPKVAIRTRSRAHSDPIKSFVYNAEVAFVAVARKECPELKEQYLEAEKRAFERNKESILRKAIYDPEYCEQIKSMLVKFGDMEKVIEDLDKRIAEREQNLKLPQYNANKEGREKFAYDTSTAISRHVSDIQEQGSPFERMSVERDEIGDR